MTGPYVHRDGHDTERAAADSMSRSAPVIRRRVLALLERVPEGLTDDEGGAMLGGDRLQFGRRRHELVLMGLVRDSGHRRQTPSGRNAIVWRIVPPHRIIEQRRLDV
jgi:hypothetical protein